MSPSSREGSRKHEWPTFSGNREEFDGFSQLLVFSLSGDGKLGYIAVSDYNPTKPYTFQGREYPLVVNLQGKDSGPDSATPRASATPRSGDNDDDEEEDDGGDGNTNAGGKKKKRKGKKKTSPSGLVTDGEEAVQLLKRMETEKAGVCYILVSSLPVNYRKLVQGLVCPHAMWQAIEGHFGTRDTTDYASSYTGGFRYRLNDAKNPEMFMQTLDLNIITFERVIDTKLSDIFKSMILQHALPASWEYIVRGWLGQAKTLSYVKLMELVSSKLERRRPEGSGQDKGKAEKAYAAVETKPTGGTIERKCFACKKPGHLVADCPENPNRGENIGTSEPSKKKQNTGKQFSKKGTKRQDHRDRDHKHDEGRRHDDGRRHEDRRSPPRGQASHASSQWTSGHSGAHDGDRGRQDYGGYGNQRGQPFGYRPPHPQYGGGPRGYGYGCPDPPYYNQPRGAGYRPASPVRDERQHGYPAPRHDDRGYHLQHYAGPLQQYGIAGPPPQYGNTGPPQQFGNQQGPPFRPGDQRGPPPGRGHSPPRGPRDFSPARGRGRSPPRSRSRSRERPHYQASYN